MQYRQSCVYRSDMCKFEMGKKKIYIIYVCVVNKYKPDSKKVGTLYKLWLKKECNNLQIS